MNDAKTELGRKILAIKLQQKLSWAEIAAKLGYSPTWTCAACLGQMSMTAETAAKAGALFGLSDEEEQLSERRYYDEKWSDRHGCFRDCNRVGSGAAGQRGYQASQVHRCALGACNAALLTRMATMTLVNCRVAEVSRMKAAAISNRNAIVDNRIAI